MNVPTGRLEKTSLRVTFESLPERPVLLELVEAPVDDGTQQQDPAGTGTDEVDDEHGKPTTPPQKPVVNPSPGTGPKV